MSIFINEQKLGASIVAELEQKPDLVNQIVATAVAALVKALVDNLPTIIQHVQDALAKKAPAR